VLGEPPDGPTENMVAIRGEGGPHFGFAGHLDVVPPGDGWRSDPFETVIENGILTGRGAADMKKRHCLLRRRRLSPRAKVRHRFASDHRRRRRLCHLRHSTDHRLAE